MLFQKLRRLFIRVAVEVEGIEDVPIKIRYGEHILDVKAIDYPDDKAEDRTVYVDAERYYDGRWESDMVNTRPGGTV